MYAIRVATEPRLRTTPALREYARLEYGREDLSWFLASTARANRKAANRGRKPRFAFLRARPSHQPVAHKGSPRGLTVEAKAPA